MFCHLSPAKLCILGLFLFAAALTTAGIIYYHQSNDYDSKFWKPQVQLDNGIAQGVFRGKYQAFLGLRYAQPPVGELRFEPPQPYTFKWPGVRHFDDLEDRCTQWYDKIPPEVEGDEDCLFLNVYTPNISPSEKYPVIFYIHGGAFMFGGGSFYGPDFLLQHPMILVTFNYRLGPLGFLSTQDGVVPGNMGLKDQSMALRWVKENIDRFGGDPNKITITGWSAGGASVHLHYMSKLSDGLFQNGISHSGCALNPWVFTESPLERAKMLGSYLKCPTTDSLSLVRCLKTLDDEEIVGAMKIFQPFLYNPFTVMGPVVEPKLDGAFISDSPLSIIQNGQTQNVPWLVSMTQDEGVYGAGELATHPSFLESLNTNWDMFAPHMFDFNWTVPISQHRNISQKIREFYLGSSPINRETLPNVVKIFTDRTYGVGIQESVKMQASKTAAPIFFYYFKFNSIWGIYNNNQGPNFDLGVAHGDDIELVYKTRFRGDVPFTGDELRMQKLLVDMYYDYAKNGNLKFGNTTIDRSQIVSKQESFTYFEIESPDVFQMKIDNDFVNEEFWKIIPPY